MATQGAQVVKIALQADVGGFVKNFAEADTATGKFGATLSGLTNVGKAAVGVIESLAQAAANTAKKIAGLGIATTASLGGMTIAAAQFESRLKNVQSLLGEAGAQQFQHNFQAVLDITREFPISANDAAEGLYNITSSGLQGADALKVLEVSARAASAGLSSVESASTAIMAVLNAYGLSAKKAAYVSDVLFQTVNLGVLRFEDLTGVLADTVGTAAAAGVTIDQLGSAIATMTLSGISADEAGTSLNRVLQSIIDPSESLAGALKAVGYESGATALQSDGLRAVVDKLRIASQGNIETLLAWFPEIRAARGALALMANEGQNYARVAGDIESKQKVAGATQRAFNAQAESTAQSFKKFMNAIHAAAIEIGQYFLPPVKLVIDLLKNIVNVFSKIPGPVKQVLAYFTALSSVFIALGAAFAIWKAKSLLTTLALKGIGSAAEGVGKSLGNMKLQETGAKIQNMGGVFKNSRIGMMLVGSAATGVSQKMQGVGLRARDAAIGMRLGGAAADKFGVGMIRASGFVAKFDGAASRLKGTFAKMAAGVAGSIGLVLAGITSLISNWQHSQAEAEKLSEQVLKGFKPTNAQSILNTFDKIQEKLNNVNKKQSEATGGITGFFKQLGKNIGDELTNIVGIDVIKDSSWDNMLKSDKLDEAQKKVVRAARNLTKNITAIFNELHPEDRRSGLALTSDELQQISLIADKAGIDLSGAFSKSGPEREKAIVEVQKIMNYMTAMGVNSGQVSEAMVKNFQDMEKAEKKMADGAASAFSQSFDLFSGIKDIQSEFASAQQESFSAQQDNYSNQKDAINQATDDQVQGVQDQIDALDSGNDEQKRLLQNQIDNLSESDTGLKRQLEGQLSTIEDNTDARKKELEQQVKDIKESGQQQADAVQESSKAMGKFKPEEMPVAEAVRQFYEKATTEAETFYNNIQELQKRGADPSVIQKFLQAGPKAAGDVVQAAVDDSTNGLIQVINKGEAFLATFTARAAEMARLAQRAIMAPTDELTQLLPQAQAIVNTMFTQGNFATVESVAAALSMDPASVRDIIKKFSITLGNAVSPPELIGPMAVKFASMKDDLAAIFDSLVRFSGMDPARAGRVVASLEKIITMPTTNPEEIAKKKIALDGLSKTIQDMPDLTDKEKGIALKIIGLEKAKSDIVAFFTDPGVALFFGREAEKQKSLEFLLTVVGQEDAIKQVDDFAAAEKLLPAEHAMMLQLLGTEEAKKKAAEIRIAIEILKGKNLPITAENVDAITKAREAGEKVANIEGKEIVITANIEDVLTKLAQIQTEKNKIAAAQLGFNALDIFLTPEQRFNALSPEDQAAIKRLTEAGGGILNQRGVQTFASGGEQHVAQFARGGQPARVWAEPETGGESYIPWAMSKRGRSTKVLSGTADAFGYSLMPNRANAGAAMQALGGGNIRTNDSHNRSFSFTVENMVVPDPVASPFAYHRAVSNGARTAAWMAGV